MESNSQDLICINSILYYLWTHQLSLQILTQSFQIFEESKLLTFKQCLSQAQWLVPCKLQPKMPLGLGIAV